MDSILKLTPLIREGAQYANGTSESRRHFLDFVVDGKSLWEALGKRHDMVSILCAEYPADETAKAVARLLLNQKADLPNASQKEAAPNVLRALCLWWAAAW
jgi:hypothetical protein